MKTHQSFTVNPSATEIVTLSLNHVTFPDGRVTMVEPSPKFEKETGLCVTSANVKLNKDNKVSIGVIKVFSHKVTIPKNTSIARITILTAKHADYLQPVNPVLLTIYFNVSTN